MMVPELLLREKFVKIYYDAENNIITAKWIGNLNLDHVKKGCSFITRMITDKGITKHISIHTQLKKLSDPVQQYLSEEWFPEVSALGLRKVGVIISEDLFTQTTVLNVNFKARHDKLFIETFVNIAECKHWLANE